MKKAERRSGASRRLTRLIYADWLPQTNGIVGSLPLSQLVNRPSISIVTIAYSKDSPCRYVRPSPSILFILLFYRHRLCSPYEVAPTIAPQMNPDSSRATAVAATCGGLPACTNRQYFFCRRLPARSA